MKKTLITLFTLHSSLFTLHSSAQEVVFTEAAPVEQIYGDVYENDGLLPMNDLDMERGYALYEAEIEVGAEEGALLEVENVRDYASVYLEGCLQGTLTGESRSLELNAAAGRHTLRLYAENIGRITYGPEILDNSKGLFGAATLDGEAVTRWTMIPLEVKERVGELVFEPLESPLSAPAFYRGYVELDTAAEDVYLDVSGWGMGEVWLNGVYMGSFWEDEKQQSILLPAADIAKGNNEIIVFELKNNGRRAMRLSPEPVFQ